ALGPHMFGQPLLGERRNSAGLSLLNVVERRVVPSRHLPEQPASLTTRLVHCQSTVAADGKPALGCAPAAPGTVLQDEALDPAWGHPHPEAWQLAVEQKYVRCGSSPGRIDCAFRQLVCHFRAEVPTRHPRESVLVAGRCGKRRAESRSNPPF